ncbi:type III secretion protein HrpZ [Pseudomonas sp. FP1740]|uniref:type III secretion protein HrpZ n=1 Tax=Pseudomonas sp. FP1740 TaxID=2954078 RepID=UPI002733AC5E|nr:type III secretion protein HrpZ [Pseudomonas sp. FP1740]WLG46815.1 type III secretion protein HrpZ [Pseudomonas sp. FP1740]
MLSLNPLQSAPVGAVVSIVGVGGQEGPQSLKSVIAEIALALTKDGHLDQDSPLGKMVGKQMETMYPLASLDGGTPEMIKAALGEVIKDKLGDNFGAAAEFGLGGSSGYGKPDLMSQVLNGLGKASLDDLLCKQGDGSKFSSSDMPLLDQVAQFMDQNSSKFPVPDSGSWKNELKEDNLLNNKETGVFRAALEMLGNQLGQQQNGSGTGGYGIDSPLSNNLIANPYGGQGGNLAQSLGQLLGDLLQQGLEKNQGSGGGGGGNFGGGQGRLLLNNAIVPGNSGNSLSRDLGQLLGGLITDGLQANHASNEVASGSGVQNQLFAKHDLASSLAQYASALTSALLGVSNSPRA